MDPEKKFSSQEIAAAFLEAENDINQIFKAIKPRDPNAKKHCRLAVMIFDRSFSKFFLD